MAEQQPVHLVRERDFIREIVGDQPEAWDLTGLIPLGLLRELGARGVHIVRFLGFFVHAAHSCTVSGIAANSRPDAAPRLRIVRIIRIGVFSKVIPQFLEETPAPRTHLVMLDLGEFA